MRIVVLDTNFLLIPFQFKIDVFKELDYLIDEPYQLVLSSRVKSELTGLSKKVGKHGAAARFALKLIESKKNAIQSITSKVPVDDWIFVYTKENNAIACTNDIQLKRKLKKYGIKVIGLRGKTKLGYV